MMPSKEYDPKPLSKLMASIFKSRGFCIYERII